MSFIRARVERHRAKRSGPTDMDMRAFEAARAALSRAVLRSDRTVV